MQNYNGEAKRNIAKYQSRNLMLMLSFYPKKKEKRPTHTKSNNNNNKKKKITKYPTRLKVLPKHQKKMYWFLQQLAERPVSRLLVSITIKKAKKEKLLKIENIT